MARTRANFQHKKQLEAAGIVGDMRHTCLYCLLHREVCVLESEWHFAFSVHCSRIYEVAL